MSGAKYRIALHIVYSNRDRNGNVYNVAVITDLLTGTVAMTGMELGSISNARFHVVRTCNLLDMGLYETEARGVTLRALKQLKPATVHTADIKRLLATWERDALGLSAVK